jgi:hypothetical protein
LTPARWFWSKGERGGKSGKAIFVAFTRPDGQLLHLIVDVLDSKSNRLYDAQPTPIEELGDQLCGSIHQREHGGDLLAGHNHGNGNLLVGAHGVDTALQSMFENAL